MLWISSPGKDTRATELKVNLQNCCLFLNLIVPAAKRLENWEIPGEKLLSWLVSPPPPPPHPSPYCSQCCWCSEVSFHLCLCRWSCVGAESQRVLLQPSNFHCTPLLKCAPVEHGSPAGAEAHQPVKQPARGIIWRQPYRKVLHNQSVSDNLRLASVIDWSVL